MPFLEDKNIDDVQNDSLYLKTHRPGGLFFGSDYPPPPPPPQQMKNARK